jgi:hypothetical protein
LDKINASPLPGESFLSYQHQKYLIPSMNLYDSTTYEEGKFISITVEFFPLPGSPSEFRTIPVKLFHTKILKLPQDGFLLLFLISLACIKEGASFVSGECQVYYKLKQVCISVSITTGVVSGCYKTIMDTVEPGEYIKTTLGVNTGESGPVVVREHSDPFITIHSETEGTLAFLVPVILF